MKNERQAEFMQNYKFCDVQSGITNAAQRGLIRARLEVAPGLWLRLFTMQAELVPLSRREPEG